MFLDYDLRGLYPKELPPSLIASVILQFYQKAKTLSKDAFLAVDTRKSSFKIAHYINKLLPNFFIYLGVLPTPIFYWLVISKKKPGIMVTASHLPQRYNGLKFLLPGGIVWVPKIRNKYLQEKWSRGSLPNLISEKIYLAYFNLLKKFVQKQKIDLALPEKHSLTPIFKRFFPIINLEISKSPFLFKTDLDADRFELFYRKKKILPDIVFTKIVLRSKYQRVSAPINMSQKLAKLIRRANKKLIFLPTCHRYFKEAYLKKKIEFAFEPSGHFYFFKELKTESPFLALRKYLEIFDEKDLDLQSSLNIFRVNLKLKKKIDLEKLVKSLINELKPERIKAFDGYFFQQKDNWCHIRLSKTELKLRIFGEGEKEFEKRYLSKIKQWLAKN